MNSLLSPAIALMNRLTYGMKFCLISILFFVPLGIVSSMLVQQGLRACRGDVARAGQSCIGACDL